MSGQEEDYKVIIIIDDERGEVIARYRVRFLLRSGNTIIATLYKPQSSEEIKPVATEAAEETGISYSMPDVKTEKVPKKKE